MLKLAEKNSSFLMVVTPLVSRIRLRKGGNCVS
jgi:hypothetical protein